MGSIDQNFKWLSSGRLWRWLLTAYWLALFAATHVPKDFPAIPRGHWDKVAHFGAFAALAFLFAMAWRWSAGMLIGVHLRFAWALIAAYGALDELTQPLVGRDASWLDWLADGAGAAAGLAVFRMFLRWDNGRERSSEIDPDASGT
jgi:VanZ family protein